jgi:cytochrome c peroxidase
MRNNKLNNFQLITLVAGGLLVAVAAGVISCTVDKEIKPVLPPLDVKQVFPQGWPAPVYQFQNNPLSEAGFLLGRKLFYDERLSADNTISCGSCHQHFAAFAHSAHSLSHGIYGLLGTRNAPTLQNLNWNNSFMWDGGINHIEVQPLAPIQNPVEMDENMANIIAKLDGDPKYKTMFKNAFGNDSITTAGIFKAMAQFMGMLYSYNSKYDLHWRGEAGGTFNASEQNGYALFQQKCNSCHTEPLLTDHSFRNNGLAPNVSLQDSGRMHITADPNDKYKFRVPTLRNIAQSSPYMHDGRFTTLSQVLDHYDHGIASSPTLDTVLTNGIQLNTQQKTDLINFLNTLSDYKFLYNEYFKDQND